MTVYIPEGEFESKYLLKETVVDIDFFAYSIWKYETGDVLYPPNNVSWYSNYFPEQIKNTYRAKALSFLQWLDKNGKN